MADTCKTGQCDTAGGYFEYDHPTITGKKTCGACTQHNPSITDGSGCKTCEAPPDSDGNPMYTTGDNCLSCLTGHELADNESGGIPSKIP